MNRKKIAAMLKQRSLVMIFSDLLAEPADDFVIVVDADWRESANRGRGADYVRCSEGHSRQAYYREIWLERCDPGIAEPECHGEWMGFLMLQDESGIVEAVVFPDVHGCD